MGKIELSAITIAELYKNHLVTIEASFQPNVASETPLTIKSLGDNKKGILVLFREDNYSFLPENLFEFLTKIIGACKLNMTDIALVNTFNYEPVHISSILNALPAKRVMLMGIEPYKLGLPFQTNEFVKNEYEGCQFLTCPELAQIEENKLLKSKLWAALQSFFNINK